MGGSPGPEFYMPTFRNALFHLCRWWSKKNNWETNQRRNWGRRLALCASRRLSVCIFVDIPALTASLGSVSQVKPKC